ETAIDLDLREWIFVDIAERGIAGSEIVECEADAGACQFGDEARGVVVIVEEQAFRDFKLQARGRKVSFLESVQDAQRGARRPDLDRREIDGDRDMLGPAGAGLGCLTGDPVPQGDDQDRTSTRLDSSHVKL